MVKISIIVPVYNAEPYLKRCADSCLRQTMQETEVILIDDCSEDRSREIMRQYAADYPEKVRCFFQETQQRQGAARNLGIRNARGEYCLFVDSDDWIEPDACAYLYQNAQGADMCGANFYYNTKDKQTLRELAYATEPVMDAAKRKRYMWENGMFWTRIYRREFLVENEIYFPANVYYEDAYFNTMTALYARSIVNAGKPGEGFYHYCQNTGSTVHHGKNNFDKLEVAHLLAEDCKKKGIFEKHQEIISAKYLGLVWNCLSLNCLRLPKEDFLEISKKIKDQIRRDIPNYRKYLDGIEKQSGFYLRLLMLRPRLAKAAYEHHLGEYLEILSDKLQRKRSRG